jgi:hypothetical protein
VSKKRVVIFEASPEEVPFFIDEKPVPAPVAAEIEDGPHVGIWLFSNRQRAEEFCWKRGLEPEFEQDAQSGEEKRDA